MAILNVHIIDWFRKLAIIQFSLFIVLFLVILGFNIYRNHAHQLRKLNTLKIKKLLMSSELIKPSEEKFLHKNILQAFKIFYEIEQQGDFSSVRMTSILTSYFLPLVENFSVSSQWYFRQMAAMILQLKSKYLYIDSKDVGLLKKLFNDDTPLVVINTAIAICHAPNQELTNLLIEKYIHERRSQYDLLRLILKEGALKIVPYIVSYLDKHKEPDCRALCYRMLTDLPKVNVEIKSLKQDLNSHFLDLSLAALAYVAYSEHEGFKELLLDSLNSDLWQVRARSAKLIGRTGDSTLAKKLEPLLRDKLWWVSFRAAEALRVLGKEGEEILKTQIEPSAKDVALQQLKLMQQLQGK